MKVKKHRLLRRPIPRSFSGLHLCEILTAFFSVLLPKLQKRKQKLLRREWILSCVESDVKIIQQGLRCFLCTEHLNYNYLCLNEGKARMVLHEFKQNLYKFMVGLVYFSLVLLW